MAAKKRKKAIKAGVLAEHVILIFVPKHNSHGKKDVTGAFLPEAVKLKNLAGAGSKIIHIDNKRGFNARRRETLRAFATEVEDVGEDFYTSVAFMCHGFQNGIQLGFKRAHVKHLAESIRAVTGENTVVEVPLFCCSTGHDPDDDAFTAAGTGDDSFADKLRDELCRQGSTLCRVMAHTTVAHATSNPMVLFMEGMGTPDGGVGGFPPVSPKSGNWKAWKRALRDRKNNTLRFRMTYMNVGDIHKELGG